MRTLAPITLALLFALLTGLHANPPTEEAINEMAQEVTQANKDAAANLPGTRTRQVAEDRLDTAEKALDDAQRNLEKLQETPDVTDAQIQAAEKAVATAETARDQAKAFADGIPTRKPDADAAYRKALEERRAARRKLQDASDALQPAMRGIGRTKELENRVRKVRRGLQEAGRTIPWSMAVAAGTGTLPDLQESGMIGVELTGTGRSAGTIAYLTLTNRSASIQKVAIPPMVLTPEGGAHQSYVAPAPQLVEVWPGRTATVPIRGLCLNRSRPPVPPGESAGLFAQDALGTIIRPTTPSSGTPALSTETPRGEMPPIPVYPVGLELPEYEEIGDQPAAEPTPETSPEKPLAERLADARKAYEAATKAFLDWVKDYVSGNKELEKRTNDKWSETQDAIDNRRVIGSDEREEILDQKGEAAGKAELQESTRKQEEDVERLEQEYREWWWSEVATELSKEKKETKEEFEKRRNTYEEAGRKLEELESEKARQESKEKATQRPADAMDPPQIETVLASATAVTTAAQQLQDEGKLDELPYPDPAQQIEIVSQWALWADPATAEITSETPATKEDLSRTIKEQISKPEEAPAETVDAGIDAIWDAVELTGEVAKDLQPAQEEPESA